MATVPHAANGGEEIPLPFYGCQSGSPPLRQHVETGAHFTGANSSITSRGSQARMADARPPAVDSVEPNRRPPVAESYSSRHPSHDRAARRNRSDDDLAQFPTDGPFHRVAHIRAQQGISERTMARRLGIDVSRYRELENPNRDLTLSQLSALQRALEVPFADLLEDRHALSRPVEERAKLLKVMKTAVALREAKINPRADRMAQMLCEQLIDLMPELAEVSGWPQFGARRGVTAVGRALQQPIDTSSLGFQD